jgi:CBS domain-containing protein
MQVREIMSRDVECIQADCTVQEAAEKMRSLDIGSLPVTENNHLVGMITDRDIVIRAVAEGCNPKTEMVRNVMTHDVASCLEDQPIEDAARIMKTRQLRRLTVLAPDHRLVGMISLGDLAVDSRSPELAGQALEGISQPAMPRGVAVLGTPY